MKKAGVLSPSLWKVFLLAFLLAFLAGAGRALFFILSDPPWKVGVGEVLTFFRVYFQPWVHQVIIGGIVSAYLLLLLHLVLSRGFFPLLCFFAAGTVAALLFYRISPESFRILYFQDSRLTVGSGGYSAASAVFILILFFLRGFLASLLQKKLWKFALAAFLFFLAVVWIPLGQDRLEDLIFRRDFRVVSHFVFSKPGDFRGWDPCGHVKDASVREGLLIVEGEPGERASLSLARDVDAARVTVVKVESSMFFPILAWKPSGESSSGQAPEKNPDLFRLNRPKAHSYSYYFFLHDEPEWKGKVHLSLHFQMEEYGECKAEIRSIDLLYFSPPVLRFLEGKTGGRGRERFGNETREVIYAPPPFRFEETFHLPEKPLLELGYGLVNLRGEGESWGVHFTVTLAEEGGGKHELLSEEIFLEGAPGSKKWLEKTIDLSPFEYKDVSLLLETRETSRSGCTIAIWAPPQIHSRGREEGEPNIVLISLGSLRADHLRCFGYSRKTSPTIDALAREGTLFQSAFAQSPDPVPSHMSLLTSLHPYSHQVWGNLDVLDSEGVVTLPEILARQGYSNMAFVEGKELSPHHGFDRGFHQYHLEPASSARSGAGEEMAFAMAREWIRKNSFKKFFLFLHTLIPRFPHAPPGSYARFFQGGGGKEEGSSSPPDPEVLKRIRRGETGLKEEYLSQWADLYDGSIRYVDESLKRIVETLRGEGILERTLIIVLSTHGEEVGDHFLTAGHGGFLYDELIHVPLIFRAPGLLPAGKKVEGVVSLVDLAPTLLELLRYPAIGRFEGKSLLPIARGERKNAHALSMSRLNEYHGARICLRTDRLKYIFSPNGNEFPGLESLKALAAASGFEGMPAPEELFSLTDDPRERVNVLAREPEAAGKFSSLVKSRLKIAKRMKSKSRIRMFQQTWGRFKALGLPIF